MKHFISTKSRKTGQSEDAIEYFYLSIKSNDLTTFLNCLKFKYNIQTGRVLFVNTVKNCIFTKLYAKENNARVRYS